MTSSRAPLILLCLTYALYFGQLGILNPYLGIFLDGRGFSSAEIGELFAVITLARIIGPSLWASLADKSGKIVTILRFGSLLTALSFVAIFWVDGFWPLTLVFGLMMLFWTAILPQLEVLTMQTVNGNPAQYGRVRLWGSIGFIILTVMVGRALDLFSTEAPIAASMLVLVALFLATLFLKPASIKSTHTEFVGNIWKVALQRPFVLFLLAMALLQVSFGAYYGFFSLYLRDLGYTGQQTGLFIALGVVAEIGIFLIAQTLIQRFGIWWLLVLCLVLTSLRWYVLADWGHYFWLVFLSQLLHALSFGLTHSVAIHFIHQYFPSVFYSRAQALYSSLAFGIGGALGNYSAGQFWAQGQGAYLTFMLASAMAMLGAIAVLFIPRHKMETSRYEKNNNDKR